MDQAELEGMPVAATLRLVASDGQVFVACGHTLVCRYDADDNGMRNLVIVALTDAGRRIDEVARVFGLTATYVSILRGRAHRDGSAGLVKRRGRPRKLSERQVARAQVWAGAGWTQRAIADRLGVARSVIGEVLARVGPAPVQDVLPEPAAAVESELTDLVDAEELDAEESGTEESGTDAEVTVPVQVGNGFTGSARIATGTRSCRYAGAMLLYPYLHMVGAGQVFASLTGGPARRYDDLSVLTSATLAFALGVPAVQGTKHLRRADAGAATGLDLTPQLATLRARLGVLADGSDPLALQRGFAAGLLAADPADDAVYFVDDHFVPYPSAFTACHNAGAHWVTYRRAPLTELTTEPHQSQVVRSTTTVTVMLAEETVANNGYAPPTQLTLYEHGSVVLQVLTSDMSATGAGLLCWLRARWRIENMSKYAAAHNGIDTLADYLMDIGPDHRKVTNPARTAARDTCLLYTSPSPRDGLLSRM